MQIVYITHNDRRAFLAALKPGMSMTVIHDDPGTFYIPGVDISFRIRTDSTPTTKETE